MVPVYSTESVSISIGGATEAIFLETTVAVAWRMLIESGAVCFTSSVRLEGRATVPVGSLQNELSALLALAAIASK